MSATILKASALNLCSNSLALSFGVIYSDELHPVDTKFSLQVSLCIIQLSEFGLNSFHSPRKDQSFYKLNIHDKLVAFSSMC